MPPFMQDAMGDTFRTEKDAKRVAGNAFYVREKTGIPLSATFNNIWVRPDEKNLDIWIENFKPLYDIGINIVTLPHTSWVATGRIQRAFPDIYIKNTILREVTKPNEIVSLASMGFNYINLDRDIMRDQEALVRIKQAKEYCAKKGNPIKLSLLVNEHCWGGCPIMPEHYQYNSTREGTQPQYFNSEISRISCSRWDAYDPAFELKQANLPPWREDWEELLDVIDVFKLHGRENFMRMKESMDIIERWDNNDSILYPEYVKYMEDIDIKDSPINIWRQKIKTCKFDCWDCNYCESVVESHLRRQNRKMDPFVDKAIRAIDAAVDNKSNFNPEGYDVIGLSSNKVRHLLNNLCDAGTVYADVGCYMGSTLFAALMGNQAVKAYAIDDFGEGEIRPRREDLRSKYEVEDPFKQFIENGKKWFNQYCSIGVSDRSLLDVEFNLDYRPSVIFYDADNKKKPMLANLEHLHKAAEHTYILVVDDANFDGVVDTTKEFCKDKEVRFERIILTETIEDENDWWNGLYILVIHKPELFVPKGSNEVTIKDRKGISSKK